MKKLDDMTKEWKTKDYVQNVPPIIGGLIILIAIIISGGKIGITAISIMLAFVIAVSPYAFYNYFRVKKVKEMEDQFPMFLRDVSESIKSGMTLPQAVSSSSNVDYGILNSEIRKIHNQISWGLRFDRVLDMFGKRLSDSNLISKSVKIIMEAYRSGGNIASTMETVASDATTIKETEKERKSKTSQQVLIMYLIYFMFLGIIIALLKILIPMITGTEGGFGILGGGLTDPCKGSELGICEIFSTISLIFGFETGGYYKSLFFSMVLIQGIFSGLVAGQIGDNSVSAGLKHSLILSVSGFVVFIILVISNFI